MLYEYECPECGNKKTRQLPVARRHSGAPLCALDQPYVRMQLVISPVAGNVKNPAVPRSRNARR